MSPSIRASGLLRDVRTAEARVGDGTYGEGTGGGAGRGSVSDCGEPDPGRAELDQRVRDRIEHGEGRFYVVVPMTPPDHEVTTWVSGDVAFGVPISTHATDDAVEEAQARSQHRLDAMLERIASLGGEAEGEVGETDPLAAVKAVLEREAFDEVLVSTLPVGMVAVGEDGRAEQDRSHS